MTQDSDQKQNNLISLFQEEENLKQKKIKIRGKKKKQKKKKILIKQEQKSQKNREYQTRHSRTIQYFYQKKKESIISNKHDPICKSYNIRKKLQQFIERKLMNHISHINTPSQPIQSQQLNHTLLQQRSPNIQGQQQQLDQVHHLSQMHSIQQQQNIQQMSQYPNSISQQQNLTSSTSSTSQPQSTRSNISYQQVSSSQQGNKLQQQQPQLQVQNDGYPQLHNLQNQQVQQIQHQNQINQQATGLIMQGQYIQQPNQQYQGQINYQPNQNQQGMGYIHQNTGSKQQQQQLQQPQQIQQQQYVQQQDSRRNSSRSDKNSQSMHSNSAIPNNQQPSLVLNNNLVGICSEKDSPFSIIEQFVEPIYEDFVYLTEKILDKTMKSANKQLQDTLMNYFLENHVSNLIIKDMNCISKRAVRYEIEKTMQKNKTAKYMNLLNAFEVKVRQFAKEKAYENLLMQLITDENSGSKQSEQWKTLVRKRILALLLYIHWQTPNSENIFNDFFAIWDLIYPNHPLPQKVKKSAGINQGSGSQISSQYVTQNGIQQQEKLSNPNKGMKRNKQKVIDNMNLSQASLSSQISNNSQSTSLFQNSLALNQSHSHRGSKANNQSPEIRRKSDKEISSQYSDNNQFNQQMYNQNQGLAYPNQNQRQQMLINQNQQQNQIEGQILLNSGNSAYYLSQGTQGGLQNGQQDYNQNINQYYPVQQSQSAQFDQNYLQIQPNNINTNLKPSGQVFKGRMRSQSWDDQGQKRDDSQGSHNIQSQQQYFQPQQNSQFYHQQNNQQANQQYGYDQQNEYYDPQYSNPSLSQQNSSTYYSEYQNNNSQQQQIVNRQTSASVPQNINDVIQQQQQGNALNNYGYNQNQSYLNQQYQGNSNYNSNFNTQQQYQQVQKIPFYQNNAMSDIQEVKQEGSPSSQNTQESNNNQFFHLDKIVLADPESPDQRLKRISQQNPQSNYTPMGQNSKARYSLQYNQLQQNQQEILNIQHQQQTQFQQQSHQLQPPVQQQQPLSKQPSQQQQQPKNQKQYQASQNVQQGVLQGQYDQTGNTYQMVNNTKQEEDLYSSSSHFSGSNQPQQRSAKGNKSQSNNSGDKQFQESPLGIKNKNGAYMMNTKQEEVESVVHPQTSNNNNNVTNLDEIEQAEHKGDKKRNTLQNVQLNQQLSSKGKDKRLSSPSVINSVQSNENSGGKLQQIQLQSAQINQHQNSLPDGQLNQDSSPNNQDKLAQVIYQEPINKNLKNNTQQEYINPNDNQSGKNKNKQNQVPNDSNSTTNNQNSTFTGQNKEISPTNNGLYQEYQNNEDQFLNLPNQANRNDDKFIRNSQRQNTGMSIMSIESEKPFKRSDTRNMTGLSNISIESDKEGRTPNHINRSKFFFRHQNSLEFPSVVGMRTNFRQGTAISNISDGIGAADLIGNSQTNIHQFFSKRSNFKQFSGLSQISIEGNDLNYLQYMQTSNQSQNFGNISRSQMRKRTNLSVDSLARFNIKPDLDLQNLSFDLDNLKYNGQILPQDNVNEANALEDSKNNPIFSQYNFSPTNNEIQP